MFSFEYYQIFKVPCFEEHLQKAASIRRYFYTCNLNQPALVEPTISKFLFQDENIKNISKIVISIKKKDNSDIYKVYVMFFLRSPTVLPKF